MFSSLETMFTFLEMSLRTYYTSHIQFPLRKTIPAKYPSAGKKEIPLTIFFKFWLKITAIKIRFLNIYCAAWTSLVLRIHNLDIHLDEILCIFFARIIFSRKYSIKNVSQKIIQLLMYKFNLQFSAYKFIHSNLLRQRKSSGTSYSY